MDDTNAAITTQVTEKGKKNTAETPQQNNRSNNDNLNYTTDDNNFQAEINQRVEKAVQFLTRYFRNSKGYAYIWLKKSGDEEKFIEEKAAEILRKKNKPLSALT